MASGTEKKSQCHLLVHSSVKDYQEKLAVDAMKRLVVMNARRGSENLFATEIVRGTTMMGYAYPSTQRLITLMKNWFDFHLSNQCKMKMGCV